MCRDAGDGDACCMTARCLHRLILGFLVILGLSPLMATGASAAPAPTPKSAAQESMVVERALERRVLALTNRERVAHGCAPLRDRYALRRSSRIHTVRMARHETMSHQLPGEPRFTSRITRAGYRSWTLVAENVARGFDSAEGVVQAWMESPGHRRNILNCRLRDLGVGVVSSGGQLWWTQNFGRR